MDRSRRRVRDCTVAARCDGAGGSGMERGLGNGNSVSGTWNIT